MKLNRIPGIILFVVGMLSATTLKPVEYTASYVDPVEEKAMRTWVESAYDSMSLDERIGQLFIIRAHSDKGEDHIRSVEKAIEEYAVGGLCFFQGTPEKQVTLTNRYQALSKIPMLVTMDAEWGLGMRHKEHAMSYPRQLTLGALRNDKLIYQMGMDVGRQLKRIGVHMNFAPVVDVNNNYLNPVINDRSFGSDRLEVAKKGYYYMLGLQDAGVLACAKHFPGHGDTDVDSHKDLPQINHGRERLDSIELFPFRVLAQHGVAGMMVAHLNIPALIDDQTTPTTLSRETVDGLLIDELGFEGLVITDAMEMEGVTKYHEAGEAEAKAILAGNDMICLPKDLSKAHAAIKSYVLSGRISGERLERSVKKILRAKYSVGMTNFETISTDHLNRDLFRPESMALRDRIIRESITLVENRDNVVPIRRDSAMKIAVLSLGMTGVSDFQSAASRYAQVDMYHVYRRSLSSEEWLSRLNEYDLIIAGFHNMSKYASRGYGLRDADIEALLEIQKNTPVIATLFGSPYSLRKLGGLEHIVVAYGSDSRTQEIVAEGLFGAYAFSGRLPVSIRDRYAVGHGISSENLFRLGTAMPESVGMISDSLARLDSLMDEIIRGEAAPGGQLLVAKDGRIIYNKSFGHHTYEAEIPVGRSDIYDLASLTKILATTLAVMRLSDEGKISVFSPIGRYLPELAGTDKAGLIVEDILTHTAGLKPWIPFYRETMTESRFPRPSRVWYERDSIDPYIIPVAHDLYMHEQYIDTIWDRIVDSELRQGRDYKYSDLGFYMIARMVERVSGVSLDRYVDSVFYRPLALSNTRFNPWKDASKYAIPPTEIDNYFRFQEIDGYVHDMGAAMLGGVAGHAGLFSNAYEVATLMQMLLNGGYYGGYRFLSPTTVALFTARPLKETRRGLGFDMKQLDPGEYANMASDASFRTFGHLGFTGTCAWADPTHNLIFIFLSNRTYPDMRRNKLSKEDYRIRLHQVVYNSFMETYFTEQ